MKRWLAVLLVVVTVGPSADAPPAATTRPAATRPAAAALPLPEVTTSALTARYAANRAAIRDSGAGRALARPDRQFLVFDPRGDGRAVEVVGDLAAAERVIVLVPGSDTGLATFDQRGDKPHATPAGGARAVYRDARATAPGERIAVLAWLGYDAPDTLSLDVAGDRRARDGATELRQLVATLSANGAAVSMLCHSYGSVVCGYALPGLPVTDVVVFGSPGMPPIAGARARVWATRGARDWIRHVPHVRLLGGRLGLGADPVEPDFGARVFSSGAAGHSDYLRPGSTSLHRITLAALGAGSAVPLRV